MTASRQSGLTLPELLIALLIFSMVSTATVAALRLGVEARDQLKSSEARLADLQIAAILLKEDLAQLRLRTVRDEFGDIAGPPFRGGREWRPVNEPDGERLLVAFVRAGWTNPNNDAPRSTLQYVEYLEKDGALVRRFRPFLDDARGQPRFERRLIGDARDLKIEFLTGLSSVEADGLAWADAWPVPGTPASAPRAIALIFNSDRYGAFEHRFWIGAIASAGGAP